MPDFVLAARRYLAAQVPVTAALGSDPKLGPWLFRHKLQVTVEGSQQVACVLTPQPAWALPNQYNTAEFPRLRVELYADPARDAMGNVLTASTWDKITTAYDALNPYLHWMSGERVWGDVRVIGSKRLGELDYRPIQDGDGGGYAVVDYGLML